MRARRWLPLLLLLPWVAPAAAILPFEEAAPEAIEPLQPRSEEPPTPRFGERIDVALTSLMLRVVDSSGQPVVGLGPDDFVLRIDGVEVALAAVEWIGDRPEPELESSLGESHVDSTRPPPPEARRLVLFFVQASLHPSRISGQMRMQPEVLRLLEEFGPDDRIAVVSFDSHLKLRADFTDDRERLREALADAIVFAPEPRLRPGREPSLVRRFDFAAARRAASPEQGLAVAARALEGLPGTKIVVYLGWGLGVYTSFGVRMLPEYRDALAALERASASVFVLDVTSADYHSLEVGLEKVAQDTGGTYAKTHLFPSSATARLARAVSGHYRLFFARPAAAAGARLKIDLRDRRRGEILAAPTTQL